MSEGNRATAAIRIVAFDAYGTLFDTGTGSVDATRQILERHSIAVPPQDFYRRWKRHHGRLARGSAEFKTETVIFERGLALTYSELGLQGDPASDIELMLATLGQRAAFPDAASAVCEIAAQRRVVIASNWSNYQYGFQESPGMENQQFNCRIKTAIYYTSAD